MTEEVVVVAAEQVIDDSEVIYAEKVIDKSEITKLVILVAEENETNYCENYNEANEREKYKKKSLEDREHLRMERLDKPVDNKRSEEDVVNENQE